MSQKIYQMKLKLKNNSKKLELLVNNKHRLLKISQFIKSLSEVMHNKVYLAVESHQFKKLLNKKLANLIKHSKTMNLT